MTFRLAVLKETAFGEKRVALTPAVTPEFEKLGARISIQAGCGEPAFFADSAFQNAGMEEDPRKLYGMPILNVDKAHQAYVIKRGQGRGYSGVENQLFRAQLRDGLRRRPSRPVSDGAVHKGPWSTECVTSQHPNIPEQH